jgi:hypothetical protein
MARACPSRRPASDYTSVASIPQFTTDQSPAQPPCCWHPRCSDAQKFLASEFQRQGTVRSCCLCSPGGMNRKDRTWHCSVQGPAVLLHFDLDHYPAQSVAHRSAIRSHAEPKRLHQQLPSRRRKLHARVALALVELRLTHAGQRLIPRSLSVGRPPRLPAYGERTAYVALLVRRFPIVPFA